MWGKKKQDKIAWKRHKRSSKDADRRERKDSEGTNWKIIAFQRNNSAERGEKVADKKGIRVRAEDRVRGKDKHDKLLETQAGQQPADCREKPGQIIVCF